MSRMYAVIATSVLSLAMMQVAAASPFDDFVARLSRMNAPGGESYIEASGIFAADDGRGQYEMPLSIVCDSKTYRLELRDMVMICDSHFSYIVNDKDKEVTVTGYDASSESVMANPLSVLGNLQERFRLIRNVGATVELAPVDSDDEVRSLILTFASGGMVLRSMELSLNTSGVPAAVRVEFSHFTFREGSAAWAVAVDLDAYEGKSYFINDLR